MMVGVSGFKKTQPDDLERVVEKSDTSSSIMSDDIIKPPKTVREQVGHVIHSNKFQIGVICLVILDCLLVIGELLIDLIVYQQEAAVGHNITQSHTDTSHGAEHESSVKEALEEIEREEEPSRIAAEVLHFMSIAILSLFLVELCVKLFVMGKTFFRHKMEIIDAVIVIVSFGLDIAFIDQEGIAGAFALLVILRLWRIGRVVNGVILSMKTQAEKKLVKEKGLRQAAEMELVKFREYCTAQEREIEALQVLLTQHDIQFKKMDKPSLPVSTIDVVAEVNQYIEAARMTSSGSESPC